jgi:hypothetical protein
MLLFLLCITDAAAFFWFLHLGEMKSKLELHLHKEADKES